MKFFLIALALLQISTGVLSIDAAAEQRGLIDIWDMISPIAGPVALGLDNALATVSNINNAVNNAVSGAIYGVTQWIGGLIPPLGKRDVSIDGRAALLAELTSFQVAFRQALLGIAQKILSGASLNPFNFVSQVRQLLAQLKSLLQTHLDKINSLVTSLIPTMTDATATQAISSVLKAVQAIEQAIQKLEALFSS